MRFPNYPIEFEDIALNKDLLVRERLLLGIKKFNTVFYGLLLLILIHYSQIITLRMEVKFQGLGISKSLNSCLSRWNFNKTNSRVLFFREGGVHNKVSLRGPCPIFNALNSD